MALNQRIALFISCGLMFIALLFFAISNGLPRWGVAGGVLLESAFGLWQLCHSSFGPQVCGPFRCTDVTLECGTLTAARLFLTVACISAAISILLLIICIVRAANTPPILLRLTKGITVVSFATGFIGVVTGIAFVIESPLYSVGAGAILGIVAVIINSAGATMAIRIPEGYQSV